MYLCPDMEVDIDFDKAQQYKYYLDPDKKDKYTNMAEKRVDIDLTTTNVQDGEIEHVEDME